MLTPVAKAAAKMSQHLVIRPGPLMSTLESRQGALLVGFTRRDGDAVAGFFRTVEPGFTVSHCPRGALEGTLADALYGGPEGQHPAYPCSLGLA